MEDEFDLEEEFDNGLVPQDVLEDTGTDPDGEEDIAPDPEDTGESEEVEEETAEEEQEEEKETEEPEPNVVEMTEEQANEFIKDLAGVDSVEELKVILDDYDTLLEEREQTASRIAELEAALAAAPKEVQFESELHKKAYEFFKDQNVSEEEALSEKFLKFLTLQNTDFSKLSHKQVLFEQYMLDNSDLPREKAEKLFNKEYKGRYESFEDEEDEELAKIAEEKAANKARRELNEMKKKYTPEKPATTQKEEKQEEFHYPKEAIAAAEQTPKLFDQWLTKALPNNEMLIQDPDGDSTYRFKIPDDSMKELKLQMSNFFSSPEAYDEKGKLAAFKDFSHVLESFVAASQLHEMMNTAVRFGKNLGKEEFAKERRGTVPTAKTNQGGRPVESEGLGFQRSYKKTNYASDKLS